MANQTVTISANAYRNLTAAAGAHDSSRVAFSRTNLTGQGGGVPSNVDSLGRQIVGIGRMSQLLPVPAYNAGHDRGIARSTVSYNVVAGTSCAHRRQMD